jgi:hypothetical protein
VEPPEQGLRLFGPGSLLVGGALPKHHGLFWGLREIGLSSALQKFFGLLSAWDVGGNLLGSTTGRIVMIYFYSSAFSIELSRRFKYLKGDLKI